MTTSDLLARYNYDEFVPAKFEPWMRCDESPPLGAPAPDFPLTRLEDEAPVQLSQIWSGYDYTIVEFGSFT